MAAIGANSINSIFHFETYGSPSDPSTTIHWTRSFECGGHKWTFLVRTTATGQHTFAINSPYSEGPNDEFDLFGRIDVLDEEFRQRFKYEIPLTHFTPNRTMVRVDDERGVHRVAGIQNGHGLNVRLRITITYKRAFEERTSETDIVVVAEGTRFYVPLAILEAASPIFVPVICADFDEGEDVVLEGDSAAHVGELMRFLQPDSAAFVTESNVLPLLKLADKYAFQAVLTKCEEFLIADYAGDREALDSGEYLSVAVNYQLYKLQAEYLASSKLSEITAQLESGQFDQFTKEIVKRAINRLIDGEDITA